MEDMQQRAESSGYDFFTRLMNRRNWPKLSERPDIFLFNSDMELIYTGVIDAMPNRELLKEYYEAGTTE